MVLPIMKRSRLRLSATVKVIVRVVESETATEAAVMSNPAVKVMLGVTEVLNSKPVGAFRMRVIGEAETVMSPRLPSRTAMGPSVVQAGDVALAALSAEMFVPPVAFVIVTVANEQVPLSDESSTANRNKQES
jgi:hypothetical protein